MAVLFNVTFKSLAVMLLSFTHLTVLKSLGDSLNYFES